MSPTVAALVARTFDLAPAQRWLRFVRRIFRRLCQRLPACSVSPAPAVRPFDWTVFPAVGSVADRVSGPGAWTPVATSVPFLAAADPAVWTSRTFASPLVGFASPCPSADHPACSVAVCLISAVAVSTLRAFASRDHG